MTCGTKSDEKSLCIKLSARLPAFEGHSAPLTLPSVLQELGMISCSSKTARLLDAGAYLVVQ